MREKRREEKREKGKREKGGKKKKKTVTSPIRSMLLDACASRACVVTDADASTALELAHEGFVALLAVARGERDVLRRELVRSCAENEMRLVRC